MTTNVLTVQPETTLREAMELLAMRHVSGVPVVSGGRLVGVVTGTDLMAFAAALSGVPTNHGTPDDWNDATGEEDVDDEDEAAGAFFSEMWDDGGADATERMASSESPEWNALEEHEVSEMMTRTPLVTLPPDADVESAAELMQRRNVHRVLVTEDGELLGVVSALDIVKAAAEHRFTTRTYLFNHDHAGTRDP